MAVAVAIVVTLGVPAARAVATGGEGTPAASENGEHVIRPGDTLWAIARSSAPERDPREVVHEIVRLNGVEAGALVPGSVLVVPAG